MFNRRKGLVPGIPANLDSVGPMLSKNSEPLYIDILEKVCDRTDDGFMQKADEIAGNALLAAVRERYKQSSIKS